jgi:glycosyltransferase involved in cell wall biosynthesis
MSVALSGSNIKLRILIVTQYFWPENFRINDLAEELTNRGHEVTVLTGIPNYPLGKVFPDYRNIPDQFNTFKGCRVLRAPMLPRGQGSFSLILNYLSFVIGASWTGLTQLGRQSFDVIFVFEPSPVTVGLPAVFLGKIKNVPVVFWALDLWPETLSAIGIVRSPFLLRWVSRMVSYIYNRCELVLGQSKSFIGNIQKYCHDGKKIHYFPNWAEDVYQSNIASPAVEVEYRPDLFNIVFAGNIGDAQDMPAILDAAEKLKTNTQIRWIIVGDGRKYNWLHEEVKRRDLSKCFNLLGRYPVERMPSFYAHADALLVSLKQDPVFSMTIPGKVQSYLMAGKPVLGMLDGEGKKVIQEAKAGLVTKAGDSVGLTNNILELAAMTLEERAILGKNGVIYAQREFGRDQLINKLENLLNLAIASHYSGSYSDEVQ